jgi:hypothetical protein
VELMGGAIGVESTEGAGSTLWFELPFGRIEDAEPIAAPVVATASGPRFTGLRRLVADDNQINRFLAERVLTREGAHVTLVNDGLQAVDALRAAPQGFDAVLMDIQMPVMDSLAATQAIRQELKLTALPVRPYRRRHARGAAGGAQCRRGRLSAKTHGSGTHGRGDPALLPARRLTSGPFRR